MDKLPPWSHTMIEMFEQCPRQMYHRFILKEAPPPSEDMAEGRRVHEALEQRLKANTPLPPQYAAYEPMVASILKQKTAGVKLCVETKMGLTRELVGCAFFDKTGVVNARSAIDVGLHKESLFWLGDWKTGKIKENPRQLSIMAGFIFRHYPRVMKVVACNLWLKFGKVGVASVFTREREADIWNEVLPKVYKMEQAFAENNFPPKVTPLCGWCPVSTCKHNPEYQEHA